MGETIDQIKCLDLSIEEQDSVERHARMANSTPFWNDIWKTEGDETWRAHALKNVYDRITDLIDRINRLNVFGNMVVDIGGGRGILASQIADQCSLVNKFNTYVIDHSEVAIDSVKSKGLQGIVCDLERLDYKRKIPNASVYVSTECFEHLSENARNYVLEMMVEKSFGAIISVPNNRLGPEEEPQHTIKFTAIEFKNILKKYFNDVRVEVFGPFLLGVCGHFAKKNFKLSATLPVRDEEHDLEITLASIRGVADQLVVGIDPRTTDNTYEIASWYADEVFYLENPMGPPYNHSVDNCLVCGSEENQTKCKEYMGENGINFSWVRNQCIDKCEHEWILMTEGHERLSSGQDTLLELDKIIPKEAKIAFVARQGNGQQWAFPWLFRKTKKIRFTRPVHNILDYPEGTFCVMLPQIKMIHDRHIERGKSRAKQRKAQNRNALLDDWLSRRSEMSLFYLGQEWRDINPEKSIDRLEEYLCVSNNGVQKYQARLILAKEYAKKGKMKDAIRVLHGCTTDDWSRCEHFVWLGDIAFLQKDFHKAHRFYLYASTGIGRPPFTIWWIDLIYYGHIPAQRLAQVCGELGYMEESLMWAKKVVELLPSDWPVEAFDEAKSNIKLIEEVISKTGGS